MKEYRIEIVTDHILVIDDRGSKVLLDTGSPSTFHADGLVVLDGKTFNVPTSFGIADSRYVSDHVETAVSGLVGMDILGDCGGLLIDVPGGRVVFGYPTDGMTRVPSSVDNRVKMEMEIRGRRVKVLLDTGAPTSYVSRPLTEGLEIVEYREDFNPMMPGGKFKVPMFDFPAAFAGKEFVMRAGNLPTVLDQAVANCGVEGAVGMEVLKRQPVLVADGVWVN